jgi:hypothetical protein
MIRARAREKANQRTKKICPSRITQRTKNRVCLAVLPHRISANQRAKIEVRDFFLISVVRVCAREREDFAIAIEQSKLQVGRVERNARIDKHAPALLALFALHPFLV